MKGQHPVKEFHFDVNGSPLRAIDVAFRVTDKDFYIYFQKTQADEFQQFEKLPLAIGEAYLDAKRIRVLRIPLADLACHTSDSAEPVEDNQPLIFNPVYDALSDCLAIYLVEKETVRECRTKTITAAPDVFHDDLNFDCDCKGCVLLIEYVCASNLVTLNCK
jgi:hypothetical protein